MKILTADQMREMERRAESLGITWQVLMENAGKMVAQEVARLWGGAAGRHVLVLVGPGNNGGDGLVAARHLHDWGARVYLCLCRRRTGGDRNFELTQERGIPAIQAEEEGGLARLGDVLSESDTVIDAFFGTGKARPLEGIFGRVLQQVKQARASRPQMALVALDLPSGLNPDTGAVDAASLPASLTVTLGYPKIGLFAFPGADWLGELRVVDIGFPPNIDKDIATELITPALARQLLPPRPRQANKGTFGRVLVVAGSVNYVGAAYLACAAAGRVGAGLVTLATPHSLHPILAAKLTEATHAPLPESEPGRIAAEAAETLLTLGPYDIWLVGCGLGRSPAVTAFLQRLLETGIPARALVLDADALNSLAELPGWWQKLEKDAILTPHPGEMSRLTGLSVEEVQRDRLALARRMAGEWGKIVVLKGAYTVVASPDGQARVSHYANPALASAGTGDVLVGAIAGLLAQGLSPFDGASLGVYLHGAAAGAWGKRRGDAGMLASDMLEELPLIIKGLKAKPSQG